MSLQDVLLEELRDLYSAENQLVKALPKVAKAAGDPGLKEALTTHHNQTKNQVERLKGIFVNLSAKPTGEHCMGMEGVIKEGQEKIESDEEGATKDVGLIGASLRVEHYEVAAYTTAISIAKALGHKDIVSTLTESLNEEKETAKLLMGHAQPLLKDAAAEGDEDEEEEEDEDEEAEGDEEEEGDSDEELDEEEEEEDEEAVDPQKSPVKAPAKKK